MDPIALVAALCVLGAIVVGMIGIANANAGPRTNLDRRLGRVMGQSIGDDWEGGEAVAEGLRRHREGLPFITGFLKNRNSVSDTAATLERADLKLTVSEYVAVRVFLASVLAGVMFLLLGVPIGIIVGALAAIAGYVLPRFYVGFRVSKRINKLDSQLPDALTMLANSLKSGFGLMQSLDLASRELAHPLATEIQHMMQDINVGMKTDEALQRFADRAGSADLDIVVTAMLIQQSTGGNLAEILENVGHTMRERNRIKGEIKTLTTQQTLTGFIIGGLPILVGLAITVLNPEYIRPLYTTLPGYIMLGGAATLEFFGVMVIKKILQIEV